MAQYLKTIPHRVPFGSSLSARLACQSSRRLTEVHVCWSYHSSLVPLRRHAGRFRFASRLGVPILGGYIVPRASHRAVTGSACLGRERLMEQPVSSGHHSSCETETQATCRSHKNVLCQINGHSCSIHGGLLLVALTLTPNDASWHDDAQRSGGVHPITGSDRPNARAFRFPRR